MDNSQQPQQQQQQQETDLRKVAIFFLILPTRRNYNNFNKDYATTANDDVYNRWYNDFSAFYDWFLQLEDDWIDQGIFLDINGDGDEEDEDDDTDTDAATDIYNLVTLAAFHPDWEYRYSDNDDDDNDDNDDKEQRNTGLDYEKRSPYPTLTFVWSNTIEMAGPEATERIALHNEQVLGGDCRKIRALYDRAIWLNGKNEQQGGGESSS